ncbi:MAG: adenylosuccinate lyase [Clostridia bacterium]|nr:adenylosuccinate lyase [Clostridia bacterium]
MKHEEVFGKAVAQKIALLALSPLDGRYAKTGEKLNEYFSEYALIKHRLTVEIAWLNFILTTVDNIPTVGVNDVTTEALSKISQIVDDFDLDEAAKVKDIEKVTNHDVKAVEYYIDNKLVELGLEKYVSLVHIGCTSEDINSTSYAMMLIESLLEVWIPTAENFITQLQEIAYEYCDLPMLARTHGQKATPTTVGKEFAVFAHRLEETLNIVKGIQVKGKFSGATGNYSAISTAFPDENWPLLCNYFVREWLEIGYNELTTQIEPHDYMCHLFDAIRHFNNIVLDLDLDMWSYISIDYFKQIPVKTEVGSSVMPHKVNPIRFENSEANIDLSNAILLALSNKLSRSRWQRDLSDSSSQRNIGMAFGYSLLSIEQTAAGLRKATVNVEEISDDLMDSWEVLAEPVQTMLRKYGIPDAYEKLKELTRGKKITKEIMEEFIDSLDTLSKRDKDILLALTPSNYIGLASDLVNIL